MYYSFAITLPRSTAEGTPVTEVMKLTQGVIHRVEVQFPIGCMGLAHCQLRYQEHQLYPTNPDGDFASDGYIIPIDDYFPMDTEPYALKFIGWNDDDTYQHIVTVRVGVLHAEIVAPLQGLGGALKKFLKLVGIGA